ncbi:hypothetical protein BC936DRAFT_144234, partial [Jimgerdemannia flammicorona]
MSRFDLRRLDYQNVRPSNTNFPPPSIRLQRSLAPIMSNVKSRTHLMKHLFANYMMFIGKSVLFRCMRVMFR